MLTTDVQFVRTAQEEFEKAGLSVDVGDMEFRERLVTVEQHSSQEPSSCPAL